MELRNSLKLSSLCLRTSVGKTKLPWATLLRSRVILGLIPWLLLYQHQFFFLLFKGLAYTLTNLQVRVWSGKKEAVDDNPYRCSTISRSEITMTAKIKNQRKRCRSLMSIQSRRLRSMLSVNVATRKSSKALAQMLSNVNVAPSWSEQPHVRRVSLVVLMSSSCLWR